jgi:uncharacterized protein (TIRG00374 family)
LAFISGLAFLAYLFYRFGSARIWIDLRLIGWRLGLIVLLEFVVSAANALGWRRMFPPLTRTGSFKALFLARLAANAINQTLPTAALGGESVKLLLLKDRFPVSVTTASILSAKVADALSRALFVVLVMLGASHSLKFESLPVQSLTIGFTLTVVGILTFMTIQIRGFSGPARKALSRLPFLSGWLERMGHGLGRVDEHLRELYRTRPLDFGAAVALGMAGLLVGVLQVWLLLSWIGLHPGWLSSAAIEAFAVLVSMVLFAVPASLGVQEGGKLLIFAALGLPISAGLSIAVAFRLSSLMIAGAGFAILMWLRPHKLLH